MYGMASGLDVEWVRAAKPGEPSKPAEDLEAELRELLDEVRRLREQVAALAVESARPAPGDERLPTYVGRLDASLEGGVPKGSVIAITGPGGSMKTSLALYILNKNRDETCRKCTDRGQDSTSCTLATYALMITTDRR